MNATDRQAIVALLQHFAAVSLFFAVELMLTPSVSIAAVYVGAVLLCLPTRSQRYRYFIASCATACALFSFFWRDDSLHHHVVEPLLGALTCWVAALVIGVRRQHLLGKARRHRHSRARRQSCLRANLQRLRLVNELSGVRTWDWNVSTDTMIVDPSFLAAYPLSAGAAIKASDVFEAAIHPEDYAGAMSSFDAAPAK